MSRFPVQTGCTQSAFMSVIVLVGTTKGAFLLRGGHGDWQLEGPLFKGWQVTAAGRSPHGRYVLSTASHVYGPALHVSEDLVDWRQVERPPSYGGAEGRRIDRYWTLAHTPHGLFAGVSEAGLFRAADPAGPWEPVAGLNDHPSRPMWQPGLGGLCAHVVVTHAERPSTIWCGISAVGVFRSDDAGTTWHPKNEGVLCALPDKTWKGIGFCVHGLAVDPRDPDVLYRQDHRGMYRSRDAGDSWQPNETGLPASFGFPMVVIPGSGTLLCFPIESDEFRLPPEGKMRVYRSTDGGSTWSPSSRGLPQTHAYATVLRGAMDTDGSDPCGVYFGTTSGTVHVSADEGVSWHSLPWLLPRILCVRAFRA